MQFIQGKQAISQTYKDIKDTMTIGTTFNQKNASPPRTLTRLYPAIAVGAYITAEAFIFSGIHISNIDYLIPYGGISSYGLPTERARELVTHLVTQTLAIPAYAFVNYKVIRHIFKSGGKAGLKEFIYEYL